AVQGDLEWEVEYTATDATSGVAEVELFVAVDGGESTSAGLFTSNPMTYAAAGDGSYAFYTVATDAVGNVEAAPAEPDAVTVVDTEGLTGTFVIAGDAPTTSTLEVELNSAVEGATEMRFSNDSELWPEQWEQYSETHNWVLAEGSNGPRTVYAQYRDEAGALLELSDEITYVGTLPGAVSQITATGGHRQVDLSWQYEGGAAAGFHIYRGMWYDEEPGVTAYPHYGLLAEDVVPTRPADHSEAESSSEWELVGSVDGMEMSFTDTWNPCSPRGIFYYEVFARDNLGNFGPAAAENDRATNYVLGDVQGDDGDVDMSDIGVLNGTFGDVISVSRCNPANNVGPTDDGLGTGIPLPDNYVGFEDLMIFGQNFGNDDVVLPEAMDDHVMLGWTRLTPQVYSLRLVQPCNGLKGLHVMVDLPGGMIPEVETGSLLDQQMAPCFLRNLTGSGLDLNLALLGAGCCFEGTGELVKVTLPQECEIDGLVVVARDGNNADMIVEIDELSDVPEVTDFALLANYPNPFNPMTNIAFILPRSSRVQLNIYSVDGRLVTRLVDETREAGRHSVVWMGRNDRGQMVASGTYFYRIKAGAFHDTQKMVLAK
nr:FlgD immunoglobulin-like domain containing protein [Candidatus Krumholzibacteria bacterium]